MPATVFLVGCVLATEVYKNHTMIDMLIVTAGVMIASYGELFVLPAMKYVQQPRLVPLVEEEPCTDHPA